MKRIHLYQEETNGNQRGNKKCEETGRKSWRERRRRRERKGDEEERSSYLMKTGHFLLISVLVCTLSPFLYPSPPLFTLFSSLLFLLLFLPLYPFLFVHLFTDLLVTENKKTKENSFQTRRKRSKEGIIA